MEGSKKHKGIIPIMILSVISIVFGMLFFGITFAIAMGYVKKFTGAFAGSVAGFGGNLALADQCIMSNEYWTNPSTSEIPDASTVISKLGNREVKPSESDIELILKKTREAGVNPAVAIATWGKEQNFGKRNYAFGVGSSTSFENQLDKHIKTLTDARDNKGYYGSRPSDKPIQVWWIDIYTPESDKRNNISSDRSIFFTFLNMLVPNQIVCPQNSYDVALNNGSCSKNIITQAEKYKGIPYSQDRGNGHCSNSSTGPSGVNFVDCSGFVSRVYRDIGLAPKNWCFATSDLRSKSGNITPVLQEITADQIQPGDLVSSGNGSRSAPGHVVIYVSGNVKDRFMIWESGGGKSPKVAYESRKAKPNQQYWRAIKCATTQ